MRFVNLCFILFFTFAAQSVAAQTPKQTGTHKDWASYSYAEDKSKKICYIASYPLDSEPKNVRRGKIYFLVTHRPAEKVTDEISLYMGYPLKEGREVEVHIDGQKYKLAIDGENAWAKTAEQDIKLVTAMIKSNDMLVRGVSKRGTRTVDRYSLLGFTAAHKAINKDCKVAK